MADIAPMHRTGQRGNSADSCFKTNNCLGWFMLAEVSTLHLGGHLFQV